MRNDLYQICTVLTLISLKPIILGLGNVDCTGRLKVGTGIKKIYCRHCVPKLNNKLIKGLENFPFVDVPKLKNRLVTGLGQFSVCRRFHSHFSERRIYGLGAVRV